IAMTNLEIKVDRLDERVSALEQRVTETTTNVNNLIAEMRDFKTEMRQQNKMRAEEIREIRQDMKNMQASLDAKIDGMGKHVRNLSVATIIGVATIAITVVYSILMH
ncbi:MAG: hypothetical protein IKO74_05045, partial [Selenomonadaceae bacterium]|nr:hypothetical protein [Selenomonadaceae bacterium]